MQGVSLRPAVEQDEEFQLRVYASTRAEELALTGWPEPAKEAFARMQFTAQRQQYRLTYPAAVPQIIEFQGRPAGRLIVNRSADEILLVDIALLPEYRNQGLGTAILRALQAEGIKIHLHVIRSNPAANLYQRLGFVFVGEEEFYAEMEWSPATTKVRHPELAKDLSWSDSSAFRGKRDPSQAQDDGVRRA